MATQTQVRREQTKSPLSITSNSISSSSSSHTPNLLTLIYTKKWDQALATIQKDPTQTSLLSRYKDLPLHEACQSGAPFHLIQLIHKSNPTAISQPGFCGRLPIHYASYSKPSLHIIKYLIKHHPESVMKLDDDGRLPLHLAVVRNAPKDVIQTLIASYPKSLEIVNAYGNTPVNLARNDIVYDLLVEEQKKPRGVEKGLDVQKKLMKGWLMEDSSNQMKRRSPPTVSISSSAEEVKSPLIISPNESTDSNHTSFSAPSSLGKRSAIIISGGNSNNSPIKNKMNPSRTPTTSNKKSINATKRIGTSSTNTTATTRSASPSDRSYRTIQATDDDIVHLEQTSESNEYKASRLYSPKSLMDFRVGGSSNGNYGNYSMRRPMSSRRREIMSTKNRRKALPSPTRMRMVVHPIWK